MVGIQGLGGVPEPKSERPAKVRGEKDSSSSTSSSASGVSAPKDDVKISTEAKAAAEIGRIVQLAKTEGEIRADRVEAARQAIERGDYKNPEVVKKVAEKLSKFLV